MKSFARYLVITFWERIWTRLLFYGDFFASGMKFVMVRRVYNDLPGLFLCVYIIKKNLKKILLTKFVSPCRTGFHFQVLCGIKGIFAITHFRILYNPLRVLKFENRDMKYNFTPFRHLCKVAKSAY